MTDANFNAQHHCMPYSANNTSAQRIRTVIRSRCNNYRQPQIKPALLYTPVAAMIADLTRLDLCIHELTILSSDDIYVSTGLAARSTDSRSIETLWEIGLVCRVQGRTVRLCEPLYERVFWESLTTTTHCSKRDEFLSLVPRREMALLELVGAAAAPFIVRHGLLERSMTRRQQTRWTHRRRWSGLLIITWTSAS